jgi:hypothetical protein
MSTDIAYDSQLECPLCVDEGVVSLSGRAPHLWVHPHREPPMSCAGVHGPVAADILVAHGIDPTPPGETGSGLAPSRPTHDEPNPEPVRQGSPPAVGAPDGVSDHEQESAYRDAPIGDVRQEPLDGAGE